MMRLTISVILAASLAACATPVVQVPKEVKIEVPVPCKADTPKRPDWATKGLAPDADIFDQTKALLAERKQHLGFEAQLEAAISACQP